jgi:spore coat protein A, manganese oxidase
LEINLVSDLFEEDTVLKITRREAIKLGLTCSGSFLLPLDFSSPALAQSSPQIIPFQYPIKFLPVLSPVRRNATTDFYEITMEKALPKILSGLRTEIWTYNGSSPSPIIRQGKGRQSIIRFINNLDTPKSIHLCGMASLPQYDGYPEDLIPPGFYKDYHYPNNRAATYWYHDNAAESSAHSVYMGLVGIYIVADDFEGSLPLPKRGPEGEFDIPLIIQDKRFADDGRLVFDDHKKRGLLGDVVLVNGVPWPYMKVANRKYRFRVVNASVSRTYQLALSTGEDLIVIGTDGGLMYNQVAIKNLRIGMAERYEFIIDFSKYPINTPVFLENRAFSNSIDSSNSTQPIMRFDVERQEEDNTSIPIELRASPPLLVSSAVRTRKFSFGRGHNEWTINNRTWDQNRIDANPAPGDIEIWNLVNEGSWVHSVQIHQLNFQILDRNGKAPLPYERGWKNVVWLDPFEKVRIIGQFATHQGKYLINSCDLIQKDYGMMTQFEVGKDGVSPLTAAAQPLPAKPLV